MQIIKYIQAKQETKGIYKIPELYFDQLNKNKIAFNKILNEDEVITLSKPKNKIAGNDAQILKILKAIKLKEKRLTDEQEQQLERLLRLWQNGEIPAKITKTILTDLKKAKDTLEAFFTIQHLVPGVYFDERKEARLQIDGKRQIILSCFLKRKDK
jgi:hypothetical protein